MLLITEENFDVNYITESNEGKKNFYITGPFIQTEVVNKNKRLYEKSMMVPVLEKYINEKVAANKAWGELQHPKSPDINLDRVCILIKELNWDKNSVQGKALVTETQMGNIVKGLLEAGGQLGVSTRGMGELIRRDDGITIVAPNYHIATAADVVADPSAPDAFVRGIMEGVEFFYDEKNETWIREEVENTKNIIKKMSKSQIEERKLFLFERFMNSI